MPQKETIAAEAAAESATITKTPSIYDDDYGDDDDDDYGGGGGGTTQ